MHHNDRHFMIQGTGSNVGKSILVAGLCRALLNRGWKVAPFKPQNMSNNAAVGQDGGEIGRAQALQALASKRPSSVHMNPILLKPETDIGAQVIVQGQRKATVKARDYGALKPELLKAAIESYEKLQTEADIIVVEGAGSVAETNLRMNDIANMGFAEAVNLPVFLAADIDRGGVIAQLVGTKAVLETQDSKRIQGFLINKFRGDKSLFDEGVNTIETMTSWPSLGVVPWFKEAAKLPAEDALDITYKAQKEAKNHNGRIYKIAVPQLSRLANFDDLDPLKLEPQIDIQFIKPGKVIPADTDMIMLMGTKSTISEMKFLRAQGWEIDIKAHARRGGRVIGICGGYQLLGKYIHDYQGIEGPPGSIEGLGLLDVETEMTGEKRVENIEATDIQHNILLSGYEIHIGRTSGPDCQRPLYKMNGENEGASSLDGQIRGTYIHGLFSNDMYRRHFIQDLGIATSSLNYMASIDGVLDRLADHLEAHLDIEKMLKISDRFGSRS